MNDFDYDCLERKRLARQAKYRKCGSKSRKCSLSTDHMTYKQWRERCGAVMSISIGRPISWEDFKAMSKQTQEEYIRDLMDTYGANATSLASMFKIRPSTVRRYIASADLNIKFKAGHSMNAEQRAAWESFLDEDVFDQTTVMAEPETIAGDNACASMTMNSFSLPFSGKIDISMISNSLLHILGDNASGRIEIICNIE